MRRRRPRRWVVALVAGSALVGACSDEPVEPAAVSSTGAVATDLVTTTTSAPSYPPSPTSLEEALVAMDGLYAPYVLRPATVGLDPFALRDDPTELVDAVSPDRLLADVRRLAVPRSADDPEGLADAADLVRDAFEDSGYAVQASGDADAPVLAVTVGGTACPERALVVSAHYDAPAGSPGAWDASGAAALLEVARVLAERPRPLSVVLEAHPVGSVEGSAAAPDTVVDGGDADGAEVVAGLVLDGVGRTDPATDDDGLVGLSPQSVHLVGDPGSEYLARVVAVATGRFLPAFWAFTSVTDLDVFPEFAGRPTDPWWAAERQALLVTDTGPRRDERVGTDDDLPTAVDRDALANAVRAVLVGIAGVGGIDADGDRVPDACQRTW